MPKYVRSKKGEMQRASFKGFDSVAHMTQFLARCDAPTWKAYQKLAQDYLRHKKTPPHPLRKSVLRAITKHSSQKIVRHVELEHHHRRRTKKHLGGGIYEAVSTITNEAWNLAGLPYLMDSIGKGPTRKELSLKQKMFARAVDETYQKPDQRLDRIGTMTRLPEYDSGRISVWKQASGELFVAVHGTKLTLSDLRDDAHILAGYQNVTDPEVDAIVDRLDAQPRKYDIGGHSLATAFIFNALPETGSNVDGIYLFNPASSPLQEKAYLKKMGEDPRINFFVNEGDMISSGLYQQLNKETLADRTYVGPFRWGPLSAHGLPQWYGDMNIDPPPKKDKPSYGFLDEENIKHSEWVRREHRLLANEDRAPLTEGESPPTETRVEPTEAERKGRVLVI